ncbi:MAG: tRNA (N(6)-L-threonylcarbamoyladenosine(37)-C(2))-methylthiotransferase MtaB [Ignavibacteriales bacterium]|nr:tRNA (N(6)-L-threonylcarbamoyladenosine(37)-C(2))-methylthiotransferase MtaB [Ignavibacteriales bacterium]
MKHVALHTLGCKLNFAETSTIGRQFVQRGYTPVHIDDHASVVVINTCSVTERADRECRQLVRRALRHSPDAFVIVAGCYAQLRPEEIAAIPGVDLVLGTQEKFDLFKYSLDFVKNRVAEIHVSPIEEIREFSAASSAGFAERTRAFLKIQDGCDYNCAFCTIPLARGGSRSVPVHELLSHVREAVESGYKEVVLTGVNVGDYGRKIGTSLLKLLREFARVDGLERIRVSSIEPNLLTDELLDFWVSEPKLCNHFHIPLQSGSDVVLNRMRRRYVRSLYASRVERIKAADARAGIGVDVIVGFPGESDSLFGETHRFLLDLPVSYLHVFSYSERPNTPAATFDGFVEPRVRAERSEKLRELSLRKRRVFHESFIGRIVDVLFEEGRQQGRLTGLTEEYVRVDAYSSRELRNQIIPVRITAASEHGCEGEIVEAQSTQRYGNSLTEVAAA